MLGKDTFKGVTGGVVQLNHNIATCIANYRANFFNQLEGWPEQRGGIVNVQPLPFPASGANADCKGKKRVHVAFSIDPCANETEAGYQISGLLTVIISLPGALAIVQAEIPAGSSHRQPAGGV